MKSNQIGPELIDEYEQHVEKDYIFPNEISEKDKSNSYLNYSKNCTDFSNNNCELIQCSSSSFKESNEESQEMNDDEKSNIKKEKVKSKNKVVYIPKKIKFGQHKNESFYEIYAREIVFQIFEYNQMSHSGYNININNELTRDILQWGKNIKNDEEYKHLKDYLNDKIKNEEKIAENNFKGDFDFLIHSLNGKTLKRVLEDKKKYPFIFFGNFDPDESCNYDVIGEIKESLHNNHDEQALKYIAIIYNLIKDNDGSLSKKLGFQKKNKKIIMYVFNSDYQTFLINMLSFEVNFKKFKNNNDDNITFKNICYYYKNNNKKNKLINIVIKSDIPFIFIYIPNIVIIQDIKKKENNEMQEEIEKLRKKMAELEERLEKMAELEERLEKMEKEKNLTKK